MILILSNHKDYSTNMVLEWLLHFNTNFVRVNTETLIDYDIKIEISNTTKELLVTINNQSIEIALSDISITWFRRGAFQIALKFTQDQIYYDQLLSLLSKNVYAEQESLIQFLYYALSTKPTLGNYNKYILNKLETLFRACKLGIKVPPTLITRYKHDVKQWLSRGPMVTKGIQEMFSESLNNEMYYNFTTEINDKILSQISLKFNHSKVQGKIHKKFDIRSFYIDGKFYSAAIVSQIHKKTETDFRAYNLDKPPRIIIFKIPNIIEKSLSKLLKEFKLNCASIDLVYTRDKEFYFLEINPVGQYDFISKPCNYFLDWIIAKKLYQYEKKKIKN